MHGREPPAGVHPSPCSRGLENHPHRRRHRHHLHPCRLRRHDPGGSIFNGDTALGRHFDAQGGFNVNVGSRLSALHIVGSDHFVDQIAETDRLQGALAKSKVVVLSSATVTSATSLMSG